MILVAGVVAIDDRRLVEVVDDQVEIAVAFEIELCRGACVAERIGAALCRFFEQASAAIDERSPNRPLRRGEPAAMCRLNTD